MGCGVCERLVNSTFEATLEDAGWQRLRGLRAATLKEQKSASVFRERFSVKPPLIHYQHSLDHPDRSRSLTQGLQSPPSSAVGPGGPAR